MSRKSKRFNCSISRKPPASGCKFSERVSGRDLALSAEELHLFYQQFALLLPRREQREEFWLYLCGQLTFVERKAIEPMVLELIGPDPNVIRRMQQFIGQGAWDTTPLMRRAQELVSDWLGEEQGVVIVDGSGFPKQGQHSVGVAHQYCGHLGKIANCQEGVFLAYASHRGYAFLDERLYMPESWFTEVSQKRWQACGIPATLAFRTEPELGLEMLTALKQRGVVPFGWVTCDESYGKNPAFLDGIAALDKWYLAEVPSDTRVWLRHPPIEPPGAGALGRPRLDPRVWPKAPRPLELRTLTTQLPPEAWHRRKIKEGSKGPLMVELAFVRVTPVRDQLPGPRSWAIFRRSLGAQPETKFYLSNAPADCPSQELTRLTGMRWPVETSLEEAKGEVGMDHYETRTWPGWHHQMLLSFLAHLFLMRMRLLFQKKARLSPPPRPINWQPKSSRTSSIMCAMWPPSFNITSVAIMPPTALISNRPAFNWPNETQNAARAKSRCHNRNLVVI
jgi:SRSO17 transposase